MNRIAIMQNYRLQVSWHWESTWCGKVPREPTAETSLGDRSKSHVTHVNSERATGIKLIIWLPFFSGSRIRGEKMHFVCRNQCFGSGLDPIQSGPRIRSRVGIRIQKGKNVQQKNKKKLRTYMFSSAGCSLSRAEGFCSLDVLYGGPGISKLQFLIKKIAIFDKNNWSNFYSAVNFFQFLSQKPWIRMGIQPKMLDLKHWSRQVLSSYFLHALWHS
jgi:hypothetical protein